MNHRLLVLVRLLMIVFALALLIAAPAAAQTLAPVPGKAPTGVKKWTAKTADGQPDLQGFWTNSTYTPLQRPNGVTKEYYNAQEAAKAKKLIADALTKAEAEKNADGKTYGELLKAGQMPGTN